MMGIEKIDNVKIEILLQPHNVTLGSVKDLCHLGERDGWSLRKGTCLHNVGVREDLVELLQFVPYRKCINYPVTLSCADLH